MKGKIAILLTISILLGGVSLYLINRVVNYRNILVDRESQITQYNRILNIIVSNTDIDYADIKDDLEKSYRLSNLEVDNSNTDIIIAEPIEKEINKASLWDYSGAIEIRLSENRKVKYIWNFKY